MKYFELIISIEGNSENVKKIKKILKTRFIFEVKVGTISIQGGITVERYDWIRSRIAFGRETAQPWREICFTDDIHSCQEPSFIGFLSGKCFKQ